MAKAEAVARYLLHLSGQAEEPCPITQMQLHQLLYYIQGWSLVHRPEAMFSERIEAWEHGPVVAPLYPKFADCRSDPIPVEAGAEPDLSPEDRRFIEYVWGRYGDYSAPRLRTMTHSESPWRDARGQLPEGARSDALITEESMRQFFQSEYDRHCRKWSLRPATLEQSIRDACGGNTAVLKLAPRSARGDASRVAG